MSLPKPVEGLERQASGPLLDTFARAHSYLRISVTDRCNYRCTYCMPADGLEWMKREDLLSLEEIARVAGLFARMGVRGIRLTGGEPTVRRGLPQLVRMLADIEGIDDVAMTTNGHSFAPQAQLYRDAGLNRINVSLDTLRADRFTEITRGGDLAKVLASIDAAVAVGLTPVKVNCVVVRDLNVHDLVDLVRYFSTRPDVILRFIEYMPFSGNESRKRHVPVQEVRDLLGELWTLTPVARTVGKGPAVNWRVEETGQVLGFISPITEHFCDSCNRLRMQADGHLRTCLSKDGTPSLRELIRLGLTDDALSVAIRGMVWGKIAGHEAHYEEGWRTFDGAMIQVGG
ncbi:MAG: GTP 3',8-cyclase MoaA [Rhodobacterales bacterium]|nr:GTP 3',8-cyclase MoaA [Rhodobacterales bacterium]